MFTRSCNLFSTGASRSRKIPLASLGGFLDGLFASGQNVFITDCRVISSDLVTVSWCIFLPFEKDIQALNEEDN